MNKMRIIAVEQPVDGMQSDKTPYSYIKVTCQKESNSVAFTATPPITRNFFRDNKFDRAIYLGLKAYIDQHGKAINDPTNLATLPHISGDRVSLELPAGACYYVLDDKGKPKLRTSEPDKGKQVIGNVFTTLVVEDGESYETLRDAYIRNLYKTGAMVKFEDLSEYIDSKAKRLYADMLAEIKRLGDLESSALPE